MANVDRPNGFRPVRYLDGRAYNGAYMRCYSDDDNLFMGDLVEVDTTGVARGSGVYPTVGRYDQGDYVYGVVVGWEPDPTALDRVYHAASSTYAVFVAMCDGLVLEAQSDDATMVQTDVGLNVDVVVAAGSTTTGLSNMELNGDTANTNSTLDMSIVGMVDRPDNDAADSTSWQRFYVVPNKAFFGTQQRTGV